MHQRLATSLFLGLCAAALGTTGCGDDSTGDTGNNGSTGEATTTDNATTDVATTDVATTDVATTDVATTDAVDETGDESSGGSKGGCQVWAITYNLDGSEFEISGTPAGGAGDQVNTVQEPYDDPSNIGPGSLTVHFEDVDGAPGGLATLNAYDMSLQFVVDSVGVAVTTDITTSAGPMECGVTAGLVNGTTVAWAPPQIVGLETEGEIVCNGMLCTIAMFEDGVPVDQSGTSDQTINSFEFNEDFSGFTMESVVVQMDANATNSWMYVGTETSRELVDAPDCECQ